MSHHLLSWSTIVFLAIFATKAYHLQPITGWYPVSDAKQVAIFPNAKFSEALTICDRVDGKLLTAANYDQLYQITMKIYPLIGAGFWLGVDPSTTGKN